MNRLLKTAPGALAGRRLEQTMLPGAGDGLGAVADREFVVDAVEDGADRNDNSRQKKRACPRT
jgi:hypothetical protein